MHPARLHRKPMSSSIHYLLGLSLTVIATTLLMTLTPLAQVRETAIVVNTLEDDLNDGGGDCSLREAIEATNTDSSVDGCPADDGDDAILLPAGSYLLTLAGQTKTRTALETWISSQEV